MTNRRSTEDLIRDLAPAPVPARFSPGVVVCGMAGLMLGGLALYVAVFSLRPDLGSAWTHLPVQAKSIVPALLSLSAIWLALVSARPEGRVILWPLAIPVLLAIVLAIFRIAVADGSLLSEAIGRTALVVTFDRHLD